MHLGIALTLGVLVVLPIGGADMPVVISLLNSYAGLASAMITLVFLYLCSSIFLYGGELNAAIDRARRKKIR